MNAPELGTYFPTMHAGAGQGHEGAAGDERGSSAGVSETGGDGEQRQAKQVQPSPV